MNNMILGADHVRKAIADPNFYQQMPEFAAVQAKVNTIKSASGKRGCSSCQQRRIQSSVHGDFVGVLNSLSTSAMERLKKYFGTDTLMINAFDTATGKTVLKRY